MATILSISLAGCASSPTGGTAADNSAELESLQAQIEVLKKENGDLKSQLAKIPETTVEETKTVQKGTPIAVGEVITTDALEITIKNVELTNDVLPNDTSSYYTHYAAKTGNVYLHVSADVKNLSKQSLMCDELMEVTADYNSGYSYSSFPVVDSSATGFTSANISLIAPLETVGMHFLIDCPQEVAESTNPLFITLEPSASKDSYIFTVR